jgi:hypothetical protein
MAGLFNPPKLDTPTPPSPFDTANRLADQMTRRLQTGGSQGDTLSGTGPGKGLGLPGQSGAAMPGMPMPGGGSNIFAGLSSRTGIS